MVDQGQARPFAYGGRPCENQRPGSFSPLFRLKLAKTEDNVLLQREMLEMAKEVLAPLMKQKALSETEHLATAEVRILVPSATYTAVSSTNVIAVRHARHAHVPLASQGGLSQKAGLPAGRPRFTATGVPFFCG